MPVCGGRITCYFRTHFNWSGSTAGAVLTAAGCFDDGAVFYLNGMEAGRLRVLADPVLFDSVASRGIVEGVLDTVTLSSADLLTGDNVLAVEVHQATPSSSDILFGMTREAGRLLPGDFTIVHSANGTITTFWLDPSTGFRLQSKPTLVAPNWADVALPIVVVGSDKTVTVPVAVGQSQFHRLFKPQPKPGWGPHQFCSAEHAAGPGQDAAGKACLRWRQQRARDSKPLRIGNGNGRGTKYDN